MSVSRRHHEQARDAMEAVYHIAPLILCTYMNVDGVLDVLRVLESALAVFRIDRQYLLMRCGKGTRSAWKRVG
jgi:hypothetical protein